MEEEITNKYVNTVIFQGNQHIEQEIMLSEI